MLDIKAGERGRNDDMGELGNPTTSGPLELVCLGDGRTMLSHLTVRPTQDVLRSTGR